MASEVATGGGGGGAAALTPVESQRIIAVLEETMEKLSFLDRYLHTYQPTYLCIMHNGATQ